MSPLPGIFIPRDTATTKQPEALTAWFGLGAAELKRLRVITGQAVTAARALDDRAGTTALILAARRFNPATLTHKLIFAWYVREETGLEGAMALAKRYGSTIKRVFRLVYALAVAP